ncbi:P-loop containing nucleoside triphosphate hydrolase protein [Glomus cerebriforme]|uniref:Eukaryotic peptide chain release factor GTP-binding subunit n=1 Tax=Glomus cerebriforme TaxID=658196 RepID=A0A397SUR8_9GLOM|nr:P-loop containing nucleoside triphosphate hydrolase protein [Glomus cerebriforme]
MSEENIKIPPEENWEEAAEAETSLPQKFSKMGLNANASVFKPNVNAKEFVPSWLQNATQTTSAPAPAPAEAPTPKPPEPPNELNEPNDKNDKNDKSDKNDTNDKNPIPVAADQADEAVDSEVIEDLYGKEHINLVFIGHVDAGKSTMGGNILFLTGMIDQRTMDKYEKEAKEQSRESWYLSWALDTNKEERAKGKTVECGRAYFETDKRRYTILDAPGHKNYVPSMIGGASQADVGILVISARKGEFETGFERGGQTREHAVLAKTSGVNKLIVAINKMDDPTVNWSKDRYDECVNKLTPFLKGSGFNPATDLEFIPVSGFTGLNLKDQISKDICSWYNGPSILEYLDNMQALDRKINAPLMIPIIEKYKDMGTIVVGKIESGKVTKGQSVIIMPNKRTVEVSAVYNELEDEVTTSSCGDNVRLRLKGIEEEECSTGFVICDIKSPVKTTTTFEAQLAILEHKNIICAGYSAVLHIHSCVEEISVSALLHVLEKKTGKKSKRAPQFVKKGQKVIARLETPGPICVETFEDYPQLGRFTLRDEGKTIAIGKVTKVIEN